MTPAPSHFIVTIVCDDRPGIVHALSGAIVSARGNILESQQFSRDDTGRFFMRLEVETPATHEELATALEPVVAAHAMSLTIHAAGRPLRTLVLASRAGHCLSDLLVRQRDGHLNISIPLVMANHDDLKPLADFYGVPFISQTITSTPDRSAFETRVMAAIEEHNIELVVLARYMQVLSPEVCAALEGKIINIHHSFLPGFAGANPYRQAHQRGVKLIGATAHFATAELDEGPIIEQNVVRVDHSHSPAELMRRGQDEESRTLSQAVRWYAEHRVLLDGARTIIFQ